MNLSSETKITLTVGAIGTCAYFFVKKLCNNYQCNKLLITGENNEFVLVTGIPDESETYPLAMKTIKKVPKLDNTENRILYSDDNISICVIHKKVIESVEKSLFFEESFRMGNRNILLNKYVKYFWNHCKNDIDEVSKWISVNDNITAIGERITDTNYLLAKFMGNRQKVIEFIVNEYYRKCDTRSLFLYFGLVVTILLNNQKWNYYEMIINAGVISLFIMPY
jgi:hypothetical protein